MRYPYGGALLVSGGFTLNQLDVTEVVHVRDERSGRDAVVQEHRVTRSEFRVRAHVHSSSFKQGVNEAMPRGRPSMDGAVHAAAPAPVLWHAAAAATRSVDCTSRQHGHRAARQRRRRADDRRCIDSWRPPGAHADADATAHTHHCIDRPSRNCVADSCCSTTSTTDSVHHEHPRSWQSLQSAWRASALDAEAPRGCNVCGTPCEDACHASGVRHHYSCCVAHLTSCFRRSVQAS